MRKTFTAEQAAARDARRERFKDLVKKIAALSDSERAALAGGGFVKLDGTSFSMVNSMLLALQVPQGTVLAGFRQWLKAGRAVRKGERGASIWVPIGGKKETDAVTGATTTDSSGERPGFVLGTVFDISQTDALTDRASAVLPAAVNVVELDFGGAS